jgi:hypothetical protein
MAPSSAPWGWTAAWQAKAQELRWRGRWRRTQPVLMRACMRFCGIMGHVKEERRLLGLGFQGEGFQGLV